MAQIIGIANAHTADFPNGVNYYLTQKRDNVDGLQAIEVWCKSPVFIGDEPAALGDELNVAFSFKFRHFYIRH